MGDTQVEKQTQVLKKHKHVSEQNREKEENITDQLKYESVDNQKDDQKEQKKTLPIEGENQTRTVDIHPVNNQSKTESVRNQSDKQPKQMQESKEYKHVSEQKREQEKNITDQLKHESVDNQNDGQREQERTLPTQGESPARIVDAQPVNDSVRNQSDTQVEKQTQVLKKHKHVSEQNR